MNDKMTTTAEMKAETKTRDERVCELAYQIWEEEGRPEGRAEAHWLLACERIDILDAAQQPTTVWLNRQESTAEMKPKHATVLVKKSAA